MNRALDIVRGYWTRLRLIGKGVMDLAFDITGYKTTAIEMLYIERIIAGRLTIEDVPLAIRENVKKTLREMGYEHLADPPEEEPAPEEPVGE